MVSYFQVLILVTCVVLIDCGYPYRRRLRNPGSEYLTYFRRRMPRYDVVEEPEETVKIHERIRVPINCKMTEVEDTPSNVVYVERAKTPVNTVVLTPENTPNNTPAATTKKPTEQVVEEPSSESLPIGSKVYLRPLRRGINPHHNNNEHLQRPGSDDNEHQCYNHKEHPQCTGSDENERPRHTNEELPQCTGSDENEHSRHTHKEQPKCTGSDENEHSRHTHKEHSKCTGSDAYEQPHRRCPGSDENNFGSDDCLEEFEIVSEVPEKTPTCVNS